MSKRIKIAIILINWFAGILAGIPGRQNGECRELPHSEEINLDFFTTQFYHQLRRQARLRREYLYRKGVEERERAIQDKKDRLKRALDNNTVLDGDLRRDAIELAKKAKWDDEGPQQAEVEGDGGGGVAARDSQVRT